MKKLCLFGLFLFVFQAMAEELPKACFGRYGGEMPAYEVMIEGKSIAINPHDVYVTIKEDMVVYLGGNLELSGTYTVFKQSKNEYVIKTQLSNGKSLNYELDFTWNKKENKIYITPKNGQAAAVLERIGD